MKKGKQIVVDIRAGSVVHFVYLHLDTAVRCDKPSHKQQHIWHKVEGKPRPVIVLSDSPRKLYGDACWYLVVPLTTKRNDKWTVHIGPILDGQVNYGYEPVWYPNNLLHGTEIRQQLDPLELKNILSIIQRRLLSPHSEHSS
ncbi:MAG: hypothetical protein KDA57_03070 [Planctomycetales bacterium]|nr:hypothetical protein [Planctomycetales bacterium]